MKHDCSSVNLIKIIYVIKGFNLLTHISSVDKNIQLVSVRKGHLVHDY